MEATVLRERLKALGFDFFTGVPCSLLGGIIEALGQEYVPAVREDTALGMAAGAYLGGRRPCVLMQNSGLGYSLNVLTSLNMMYDIPVLMLISFRGFDGKDAPEHLIMGRHCVELVEAFGIGGRVCGKNDLASALIEADRETAKGRPYCIFVKEGTLE